MSIPRWLEFFRLDLDRHRIARSFFLRGLGLIYLIAILSWASQVALLVGSDGLTPANLFLENVEEALENRGESPFFALPNLFWLTGASDFALHFVCLCGIVFSLLVLFGRFTGISLLALWVIYLSLVQTGGVFMSFQWDILLLEAGFLALFLTSWRMRSPWRNPEPLNLIQKIALVFSWLLIAKLMFFSGWVKLAWASELQPEWWPDRTALDFHYMTQPLPTWTAWHMHHAPEWVHAVSIWLMYFVEILLPFAILLGRWGRVTAAIGFSFLMITIMATGNYTYFNWLTILLCIPLVPDSLWPKWIRNGLQFSPIGIPNPVPRHTFRLQLGISIVCFSILGLLQLHTILRDLHQAPKPMISENPNPEWLDRFAGVFQPFRIASGYGLFRTMTTSRPEIILEGSNDGENWLAYDFEWKVDELGDRPRFVAPHQPRVAWQFWFAALRADFQKDRSNAPWIESLIIQLLENDPEVRSLIKHSPFPDAPPRFLRLQLYDYEFTTPEEKAETGNWWKRELLGTYLRPVALKTP